MTDRTLTLKDGRKVIILEHGNFGEGCHVRLSDAKTPKEHIPFFVRYDQVIY